MADRRGSTVPPRSVWSRRWPTPPFGYLISYYKHLWVPCFTSKGYIWIRRVLEAVGCDGFFIFWNGISDRILFGLFHEYPAKQLILGKIKCIVSKLSDVAEWHHQSPAAGVFQCLRFFDDKMVRLRSSASR